MSSLTEQRTETAAPDLRPARTGVSVRRVLNISPSVVSLIAGAIIWEMAGRVLQVSFLPPLSEVLARLWEMIVSGLIIAPLISSLINLAVGFGLSLVVGVGLGILMGHYRKVDAALGIYVYALLTAPALVFAPIFFSILGDGRGSIIAVVIMYSLFIMIINTADAIRGVQPALIEMGRSYGATESQVLWRIIIPAATPMIMAGVRLGAGRAVTGMINGEMFIAVVGLGAIVTEAGGRFDGASVLAILLVIIGVALAAVGLVQAVDNKLTNWLPRTTRES
jgi:ABC-type nitrate/sulfonate/bicarbonate transport system permease component